MCFISTIIWMRFLYWKISLLKKKKKTVLKAFSFKGEKMIISRLNDGLQNIHNSLIWRDTTYKSFSSIVNWWGENLPTRWWMGLGCQQSMTYTLCWPLYCDSKIVHFYCEGKLGFKCENTYNWLRISQSFDYYGLKISLAIENLDRFFTNLRPRGVRWINFHYELI